MRARRLSTNKYYSVMHSGCITPQRGSLPRTLEILALLVRARHDFLIRIQSGALSAKDIVLSAEAMSAARPGQPADPARNKRALGYQGELPVAPPQR